MKIKNLFPLIEVATLQPPERYPTYRGFFSACYSNQIDVPWRADVTPETIKFLDNMFAFHSNEKTLSSNIVEYINRFENFEIARTTPQDKLSWLIAMKYKTSWEHLYALTKAEYNPIANVESDETFTITTEHGHTVSNTGTEQMAHGEIITNSGTSGTVTAITNAVNENSVYGFNSSNAVPSDKSEASNNGSSTRTDNLSETHTGTDTRTDNLTETHGGIDKVTEQRVREGNIGVTMTQQMLNAEVDFWNMFNFWQQVFNDIDRELTISVYDI